MNIKRGAELDSNISFTPLTWVTASDPLILPAELVRGSFLEQRTAQGRHVPRLPGELVDLVSVEAAAR